MTFYKTLKETTINEKTITAYERVEKFSSVPEYEIVISRDGIGYETIPVARTTWRKKFTQLVDENR